MAVKRRKNTVKARFEDYVVFLLGVEKAGKTTCFYETMAYKYGNPDAGALLPFEKGYSHIQDVQTITCENEDTGLPKDMIDEWDDFVEIVDDLVEERHGEWKDLKVVCFDTVDRYYALAEKYVLSYSRKKTGKPCTSINDAMGGFGRGKKMLKDITYEQLQRLRGAGYGVWFLGHTKFKNVKKDGMQEGYDTLASNLTEDLYKNIAQDADFIMMITNDMKIKDGAIVGQERNLRFTSDGYYTCGSRFSKYLPEKIEFTTNAFLDAFDNAIMEAGNMTMEQLIAAREQQDVEAKKASKLFIDKDKGEKEARDLAKYIDKLEEMMPKMADPLRTALVTKMKETGTSSVKDMCNSLGLEATIEIHTKLSNAMKG